jgi:hypothetical protein
MSSSKYIVGDLETGGLGVYEREIEQCRFDDMYGDLIGDIRYESNNMSTFWYEDLCMFLYKLGVRI